MPLIDQDMIEKAVLGGSFFGGGGGGFISCAEKLAEDVIKFGEARLASIDELHPEALVATVSFLGSPASPESRVTPEDQCDALALFEKSLGRQVDAFISCENGAISAINGWLLSGKTGKPVLDCPGDGRAHPAAVMGSMGLESLSDYETLQVFCGGDPAKGRRVLGSIRGSVAATGPVVRAAADSAESLIVVIRHPVRARYAARHGAPGALGDAMLAGALIREKRCSGGRAVARDLMERFRGEIVAEAMVRECSMKTTGGFDAGSIRFDQDFEIAFLNEFMTLDRGGKRLATFPDLICAFDGESGLPLSSGEMKTGRRVILTATPAENLKLGSGARRIENYRLIEEMIGKEIARYVRVRP